MTDALRALVAEDEPAMLSLVTRHLRELGFQVVDASDGDTAWDLAQQHTPDLVLLDVMMPGMSGWEICKRLKNHAQNGGQFTQTGVIMLTGIGENLNEMTSPLFAADAWLNKPFEFGDLDSKIREVLSSYDKSLPDGEGDGERAPDSTTEAMESRSPQASGAALDDEDDEDDEPEDDPETIVDGGDAHGDDDDDDPAPPARGRSPKSGPRSASVTGLAVAVAKTVAKKVGAAAKKVAKVAKSKVKAVAKKAPVGKKKAPAKAGAKKVAPRSATKAVAAKGRKPLKATGAKKVAKKAAPRAAAKPAKRGAKKR